MKILKNNVFASTETGTTFYSVTLNQVIDAFSESDTNIWIQKAFIELGWDAIDFEHNMYGSYIINNVLYICVTDGYDIDVSGESVNPEDALKYYKLDALSGYIKKADSEIIKTYITEYEMNVKDWDFNTWAYELMTDDSVDFTSLVSAYQELS